MYVIQSQQIDIMMYNIKCCLSFYIHNYYALFQGMGNIHSAHSTLDNEVQQAINEAKEKEIQFHKEVCQEAL